MFIRLSACLQMFESSQKDSLLYICSNEMEVVKLKPHNSTVSLQAENTNLKGSITVQLASSLTGLDLTKQLVKLLFIQPKQRRSVSHTEILPFKLMFFAQSERWSLCKFLTFVSTTTTSMIKVFCHDENVNPFVFSPNLSQMATNRRLHEVKWAKYSMLLFRRGLFEKDQVGLNVAMG